MNEKSKENAKQGKEPGSDENKDINIEQDSWDFVDLVFTGKYYTDEQYNNLVKLADKLKIKKNYKQCEQYIDLDIKSLIYDTVNGTNADLQRTLENCFNSLYYGHNDDGGLPRYLKYLKEYIYQDKNNPNKKDNLVEELYNKVTTLYIKNYTYVNKSNSTRQIDDLDLRIKNASNKTEIKIKKEIYPQFITILGIFTAITFAIFGGMNLLSNLFKNMRNTHASLGQALILASIFGFTLWGLIEILFLWISKINLIKDDKDDKAGRDDKKEDCSGSERPCKNDKCLNKNCSNKTCSDKLCLNKDCSNTKDKKEDTEEDKLKKYKKRFNIFASVFLILIFGFGFVLFFF